MSENLIYLTILCLPIFLITRMLNSRACLFCTDSKLQLAAWSFMSGQVYLIQRNYMRLMLNLMVQEGNQEYRQADISYADAIPVNVIPKESGVILTSGYDILYP